MIIDIIEGALEQKRPVDTPLRSEVFAIECIKQVLVNVW